MAPRKGGVVGLSLIVDILPPSTGTTVGPVPTLIADKGFQLAVFISLRDGSFTGLLCGRHVRLVGRALRLFKNGVGFCRFLRGFVRAFLNGIGVQTSTAGSHGTCRARFRIQPFRQLFVDVRDGLFLFRFGQVQLIDSFNIALIFPFRIITGLTQRRHPVCALHQQGV